MSRADLQPADASAHDAADVLGAAAVAAVADVAGAVGVAGVGDVGGVGGVGDVVGAGRRSGVRRCMSAVAVAAAVVASGVAAACGSGDAVRDTSTAPISTNTDASDASAAIAALDTRFDTVRVQVIDADGVSCGLCLWRADTESLRRQGLMGVTDLEGAEGMLFVNERPTSAGFWMKDTLLALDVAFYDGDGQFVDVRAMEPCASGESNCPVYRSSGEYTFAVEVLAGRAATYGMEPGGRIVVEGPCDPWSGDERPSVSPG